jgi:tRNA-splicing ligase RtcB
MNKKDFNRIDAYLWEVPQEFRPDMRVPARLYASEELLEEATRDQSLDQLVNTATLPGIVKHALAMPDIHQGYGFPIGGVVATELPHGVISPGGVGYDINCGVRLMGTRIPQEEIEPYLDDLATALYHNCPSGVGQKGHLRLSQKELDELAVEGSRWALKKGYARKEDVARTEESGQLAGADPSQVSQRAKQRGMPQVGTLGAGNHFIEIDVIDAVYDEEAAQAMGLRQGAIAVQVHCGSRGFGHQICDDYVKQLQPAVHKYGIQLPDRQLVCAPFDSPEGRAYFGAMACAANYAFANRQVLAHYVRLSFEQVLAGQVDDWDLFQVYDIAHNIAKIETHAVDGKQKRVCVHARIPGDWPAGAGAGQHGHDVLRAGGHRGQHGSDFWQHVPRCRADDEPRPGQKARPRRAAQGRVAARGHRRARRQPEGAGRGSASGLQRGRQRGRSGPQRGHRAQGGAPAAAGGNQGVGLKLST